MLKQEYNIAMRSKTNPFLSKPYIRTRVKELRSCDLFMTVSEIARKLKISRQRVHQILKQEGLPTKHRIQKYLYECPVCGTVSTFKFCTDECKKKWRHIPVVCSQCGKLFFRNWH